MLLSSSITDQISSNTPTSVWDPHNSTFFFPVVLYIEMFYFWDTQLREKKGQVRNLQWSIMSLSYVKEISSQSWWFCLSIPIMLIDRRKMMILRYEIILYMFVDFYDRIFFLRITIRSFFPFERYSTPIIRFDELIVITIFRTIEYFERTNER
jgi:hypothetical protein